LLYQLSYDTLFPKSSETTQSKNPTELGVNLNACSIKINLHCHNFRKLRQYTIFNIIE